MRILDRYLTREFTVPALYCFGAFVTLFVTADLVASMGKILRAQTPPALLARYYVGLLSGQFEHLAPASLLLASLYALWQLGRNQEITAMRSCGVSLARIVLPFVRVGLLATGLAYINSEWIAPRTAWWAEQFSRGGFRPAASQVERNHAYFCARGNRVWLIGAMDAETPERLENVKITQERPDGTRAAEYRATRADWLDGQWWFSDLVVQRYDARDNPVGSPVQSKAPPTSAVPLPGLVERPADLRRGLREWDALSAVEMHASLRDGSLWTETAAAQRRYDFHRKLAMPWACVVVTLFGVPVGAGGSRRGAIGAVFLTMIFFLAFYATGQVGLFLGKGGVVSPWLGAWLSNIVFGLAGGVLLWRLR